MTDWSPLVVALAAAVPGIVAAGIGLVNRSAIKDVHIVLNSRLTELVQRTREVGEAEGAKTERKRVADLTEPGNIKVDPQP